MVGCLVSPPWLFSDPEDGGGDIPVPGVNGLAIVVGVGRGLGGRSNLWSSLSLSGESSPERHQNGNEKEAGHVFAAGAA